MSLNIPIFQEKQIKECFINSFRNKNIFLHFSFDGRDRRYCVQTDEEEISSFKLPTSVCRD